MSSDQNAVRNIDGKGKTIKEMLFGRKLYIDYYQREYKWQTKQLEELLNDLIGVFLHEYSRLVRSNRRWRNGRSLTG